MANRKITFVPDNKTLEPVDSKDTILDIARAGEVEIEGMCGGKGICGKCKVRIEEGEREEYTPSEQRHLTSEEKKRGISLACQCRGTGNMKIYVPPSRDKTLQKSKSSRKNISVDENLKKIHLELPKPSIEDQRSDEKRLLDALGNNISEPLSPDIITRLPSILRHSEFNVTAIISGGRLLDLEEGDTSRELYGVAFDIGTTTVAGTLLDINTGKILASTSRANEQQVFGADVISRIRYTEENSDGLKQLQQKITGVLNRMIMQLVFTGGINPKKIYRATAVGNTTMTHLLLGIDPSALGSSPYVPVFQSSMTLPAYKLDLNMNPGGEIIVLPNIGSYIGSDTVGVLLAEDIDKEPAPSLTIDIGTNGEVVLIDKDKIWACSTAAGPAFEGVHIRCGMRASEGAIEDIKFTENKVEVKTINDIDAAGICGSGLINIVAELLKAGIIDKTGRLLTPDELNGVISKELLQHLRPAQSGEGEWEFLLGHGKNGENDVVITQKDLRELQMAKAAIRAGSEILIKESGISAQDLESVILTGAFGNHVKKENALLIGLLPEVHLSKVRSIDNAAGEGSLYALASAEKRGRAEMLSQKVSHIELSTRTDFQMTLINVMGFNLAPAQTTNSTRAAEA